MLLAFLGITAMGLILGPDHGQLDHVPADLAPARPAGRRGHHVPARRAGRLRPDQGPARRSRRGLERTAAAAGSSRTSRLRWPLAPRTWCSRRSAAPASCSSPKGRPDRSGRCVEAERSACRASCGTSPIHVIDSGGTEGQTSVEDLAKADQETAEGPGQAGNPQVDRRLSTLGSAKLPIPKGIDPNRARPDRKAMRDGSPRHHAPQHHTGRPQPNGRASPYGARDRSGCYPTPLDPNQDGLHRAVVQSALVSVRHQRRNHQDTSAVRTRTASGSAGLPSIPWTCSPKTRCPIECPVTPTNNNCMAATGTGWRASHPRRTRRRAPWPAPSR